LANNPAHAFYKFWARKEAVLKALGDGLAFSSKKFTVNIDKTVETIELTFQNKTQQINLQALFVDDDYEAAVAVIGQSKEVINFNWPAV